MSASNFISVVPWNPKSEAHVERLQQQRIACGWGVDNVRDWRDEHLAGRKMILWLVLDNSHPSFNELVASHKHQFLSESDPLSNTSSTTLPFPHAHSRQIPSTFTPIGHVSLDFEPGSIDLVNGRLGASSLYLSPAVRGLEFARQAIETTRKVGCCFARWMIAEVPVRESQDAVERFERFTDGRPGFSLEEWYTGLGWKKIDGKRRWVDEKDIDGRMWKVELVAMEWDLGGLSCQVAEKARL